MTDPVWTDGDETRLEDHAPRALCDVCERRPGTLAVEGEWVCEICDAALEIADRQETA